MKLHSYLLVLLFCVHTQLFAMHDSSNFDFTTLEKDSDAAPTIIATLVQNNTSKEMPSLKKLSALSFINAFDPSNKKITVQQFKRLKEKTEKIPRELQQYLKEIIVEEKADTFEEINDAKPVKLSDHQVLFGRMKISPDSQYLAYIKHNNNWPNDTLVTIHIPSNRIKIFVDKEFGYSTQDNDNLDARLKFSSDSTLLFIKSPVPNAALPIQQYNFLTKTLEPANNVTLTKKRKWGNYFMVSPNKKYVLNVVDKLIYVHSAESRQLLRKIQCEDKIRLEQFKSDNHIIISCKNKNNDCKNNNCHHWDFFLLDCETGNNQILITNVDYRICVSQDLSLLFALRHLSNTYLHFELFDTGKQRVLRSYHHMRGPSFTWLYGLKFSPDASKILFSGQTNLVPQSLPYKYDTYRAITKNATLPELLSLFLAEKQNRNQKEIDSKIIEELRTSASKRIREITKERYKSPSKLKDIIKGLIG